jgi:prolyl 4-hydroxylase
MNSTGENQRSEAGLHEPPPVQDEASNAQFGTAMSMLASPDAAQQLQQAVALIEAAADAGHAEAIARRAVFECEGVGRPADWNKALDSLADAAELGSELAGRQLILLAEDRYVAATPADIRPGAWREMRSQISIAERLRASVTSGRTLSIDPFIRAVSGLCSAPECQWLVAAAAARLRRATLHNAGVGRARTNQFAVLDLAHTDLVAEMIRARIANEIGAPPPCLEVSQVLHYAVGEEFEPHFDFLDPRVNREEIDRFGQRTATFIIYLNEAFEGGETSFPRLGISHRGRTGDGLVFGNLGHDGNPNIRTEHAGRPPTRGEKWVFSQWVRDRYPA